MTNATPRPPPTIASSPLHGLIASNNLLNQSSRNQIAARSPLDRTLSRGRSRLPTIRSSRQTECQLSAYYMRSTSTGNLRERPDT